MCESSKNQSLLLKQIFRPAAYGRYGSAAIISFACIVLMAQVGPAAAQSAPTITKVEPPSWWTNHSITPVRLVVRGTNLTGASVSATRSETLVSDVKTNPQGTCLFIPVHITAR